MRIRFSLKTLFIVMCVVLAFFAGLSWRQPELARARRKNIEIRAQAEAAHAQLTALRRELEQAASENAWRDDVIAYLQEQGVVPPEPADYIRVRGDSGIEKGMKIDAIERSGAY